MMYVKALLERRKREIVFLTSRSRALEERREE